MFLNDNQFVSDGISMLLQLLTNLNYSSSENLLLSINNLNHLDTLLGDSSTDNMYCVLGESQLLQGIYMDKITPLFTIASLDHDHYPGIKSHHLAGDPSLVNCNLLGLSGLLSSKETHQKALGVPTEVPRVTEKHTSDVTALHPL